MASSTSGPKKVLSRFRQVVGLLLPHSKSTPPPVSSTDDDKVTTDDHQVSTDDHKVSTDEKVKSGGEDINWDNVGFGLTPTDFMFLMKCPVGDKYSEGHLVPYGNLEISPSSSVLNYGQGLFEGMKVYRREDDRIMIFRPEENARRMQMGAERLLMQAPTTEQFIDAVKKTALANERWVPPHGTGTLYLRPLLMGSGAVLGIGPAPECTFLIFASPIRNSYKSGIDAFNLSIETKLHRASPGGTGGIKSITNYAPVFESVKRAKAAGFDDVLFLDGETGKHIEEASSCNVFMLKGNVISTPTILGTILPGITRKSILEIAQDCGYEVEEGRIPVEDVLAADEVFCTGTAVVVTSVASITYQEQRVEYKTGENTVCHKLRTALTGIQTGLVEDKKGWTVHLN
ncbi:hypothetical protein BDE02_09G072100 [Populus trichocarpa]|nr:hypothetical protein BDE02_09G072100 [Populus trichocarpa]